jgi:hypothetical protein
MNGRFIGFNKTFTTFDNSNLVDIRNEYKINNNSVIPRPNPGYDYKLHIYVYGKTYNLEKPEWILRVYYSHLNVLDKETGTESDPLYKDWLIIQADSIESYDWNKFILYKENKSEEIPENTWAIQDDLKTNSYYVFTIPMFSKREQAEFTNLLTGNKRIIKPLRMFKKKPLEEFWF